MCAGWPTTRSRGRHNMAEFKPLRLIAEDADDLTVISASIQDAVTKAEHLRYESKRHRFSIELNRFRWEETVGAKPSEPKSRMWSLA